MIRGQEWQCRKLTQEQFNNQHPDYKDNTIGLCIASEKRVDFTAEGFKKTTVGHEIFHAYCWTLYAADVKITPEDREEMEADLIGYHLDEIKDNVDYIWQKLNEKEK